MPYWNQVVDGHFLPHLTDANLFTYAHPLQPMITMWLPAAYVLNKLVVIQAPLGKCRTICGETGVPPTIWTRDVLSQVSQLP